MKRLFLISCAILCALASCCDLNENGFLSYEELTGLAIHYNNGLGQDFSGKFSSEGVEYEDGILSTIVRPDEILYADHTKYSRDYLAISLSSEKKSSRLSGEENFAYEMISNRIQPLREQYREYLNRLGYDYTKLANEGPASCVFVSIYIDGEPVVKANKTLFGKPAGADISEYFRYKDAYNMVSVVGQDYKMVESYDKPWSWNGIEPMPSSEYFVKGKLLPACIEILTTCTPEEVSTNRTDYFKPHGVGDEDDYIYLTFTFPARYEHYSDYCKELYSNHDAVLRTEDITAEFTVRYAVKK